ncbi:restriction endonuclease subunit S [Rhodoferax sp. TBRC 17198]|uniref:restriction endonuclease subunit S n=1 Tax=Rhodoferax potami TaxID=3068338 RepID=UPI0028BE6235|nr:restriction endonuclease subunit S [Rhodoferax sp. TBRC 17198]MDT7523416.1 restriction endonuclease subunit S [Rhodoferax sp. TBRC 17198]
MIGIQKLGDVAEFIRDGTHGSPVRVEKGIPVLSAMNVKGGVLNFETDRFTSIDEFESFNRRLPLAAGDLLLTIVGTIGRSAVIDEVRPLVFQRSVAVVRPKHKLLNSRFLFHVTQSRNFQNQLDRAANKSSQAGVYLGKLGDVEVPIPPLEEQRRIAAILDQAETLLTQRRQALAHLDTLTQSLFLDMFGDVERNPKGHPKMSLGSLVKLKSGDFLPASKMAAAGQHPVYGGNGINGLHDSYMFEESKIVIGRVGAYCGCVHVTKPQSWITDNALYLDSVDQACDMVYLAFALTEARLNQYASQSGQPLISGSRISPVPMLVPPLSLQQTFATRIQAIEALKATHRTALAQLDALFASLQQRAFAGEL